MLGKEDNELITRVSPGTPMGDLMREYWVPALLSREVPTPDSDPLRVLLLGEQLIAFRDANGQVGLIQNNCPHRGASLFFGRNEEAGLRCVYHGWKFSTDGTRSAPTTRDPTIRVFHGNGNSPVYICCNE